MKTIKPKVTIISHSEQKDKELKFIEFAAWVGRNENKKITDDSYKEALSKLIEEDELSSLEHISVSVHFVCDRDTSNKLTNYRYISFSKESPLIKYDTLTFISPLFCHKDTKFYKDKLCEIWVSSVTKIEELYLKSIGDGLPVIEANGILPGCTKTDLLITANLRQWKYIIKNECGKPNYANVLMVILPLLKELNKDYPIIFKDLHDKYIKEPNDINKDT